MKKGFTLVELLAVIVILAVIALITIPAVMKMIDNATTNSYRRSIDLYGGAVNNAIIEYQSDMIEKGQSINVTFDNIESYIEYEGNDVDCKLKQIYSDKTILLTECYVDEELVVEEKNKGYSNENYYYYTNSKKKIKAIEYIKAVEEELKDKNIIGTCTIFEDKLTCNGQDFTIKSNLENAISGTLTIENSKVKSYSNLKFATEKKTETNNEVPQVIDEEITTGDNNQNNNIQEKYATLISDADNDGKISIGDKYEYEVKPGTKHIFYVLSLEGDKVNLIMDRNICNDGTPADKDHQCNYAWHAREQNNNYGPDTAMTYLYNGTKDWTNVPDMIMNYEDENNKTDSTKGYTGITTDTTTKVTTITGKQNKTSQYQTFGNTTEPLKARLPREDEVTSQDAGCHVWRSSNADNGTCSAWLVENLYYNSNFSSYCSTCSTKYLINNNNGITNIYGYWLLSSYPGNTYYARHVHYNGLVIYNSTSYASSNGLRAVITVSKSDLSN